MPPLLSIFKLLANEKPPYFAIVLNDQVGLKAILFPSYLATTYQKYSMKIKIGLLYINKLFNN